MPSAMTQAQAKCTTGPEAGEGNSGPRTGFLGEGKPMLKNWKGVAFSKLPFITPQVLMETGMKEKNRPTMPQPPYRHTCYISTFLSSSCPEGMMWKAKMG